MQKPKLTTGRMVSLAFLGALLVLVLIWDWNWFRGLAEDRASKGMNRQVQIGHLDVDVFWPPRIIFEDAQLADADWAGEAPMGEAAMLSFTVRPFSLLGNTTEVPELVIRQGRLEMRRNAQGDSNWPEREERPDERTDISTIAIHDGHFRYVDPRDETDFELAIDTDSDSGSLKFDGEGRWSGETATLEARTGPASEIASKRGFGLSGRLDIGESWLEADGEVIDGYRLRQLSFQVEVGGPDPAHWGEITDLAIPGLPPYRLSGHLERDGAVWRVSEASGEVGDSDLSGTAEIDVEPDPSYVTVDLRSSELDFDDLAPLIGGAPSADPDETASADQQAEAARMAEEKRVLPDKRLNLERLSRFDAEVVYEAESVISDTPISHFNIDLRLKDGVMDIESIEIGLADGILGGAAKLDGTLELPSVRIDFHARNLDFHALLATQGERLDQTGGRLFGRGYIQGSGHSTAEVLAIAEGDATAVMGGGQVDAMIVEMAGLDLGEMLVTKLHPGDEAVTVHCALVRAKLDAGVATLNGAMSTDDTQFLGSGTIDLESEQMDLIVNAESRDFSLFTFDAPIRIRGPMAEPEVQPDSSAVLQGVAATILGAVTPPASVLALIDAGDASRADCEGLVERLQAGEDVEEAAED